MDYRICYGVDGYGEKESLDGFLYSHDYPDDVHRIVLSH